MADAIGAKHYKECSALKSQYSLTYYYSFPALLALTHTPICLTQ